MDVKKIGKTVGVLRNATVLTRTDICDAVYIETDYKWDAGVPHVDESWKKLEHDTSMTGIDAHYWVRMCFSTPARTRKDAEVYFDLFTGREGQWNARNPQGLVYIDGKIVQGLDTNHTDVHLEFGRDYEMYVYMYTGMQGGDFCFRPTLKVINKNTEGLYYDMKIPYDTLDCLDVNGEDYVKVITHMLCACNILDLSVIGSGAFDASVSEARHYLKEEFYEKVCGKGDIFVNCIGHTHIDVAWLWTLAQTAEKAQRTFGTVLELMKEYDEYMFMSSQPQLYKYVKQNAPELYARIKERVKEGRFEPEGAMWLEADCNLSSGESLVRQIMFGKRFFKKEFDVDSKILWLPDVFGYSAAMPQILKKSGVDKFVTSKISWNDTNTIPYDRFMWEGIDGTRVFTAFITAQEYSFGKIERGTTYNSDLTPACVAGARMRLKQKQYTDGAFVSFGYGDGGGGPTREMLENQRRLAYGIPGIPKTEIGSIGKYLEREREKFDEASEKLRKTPEWCGELYLEYHRGTYTSMAKNKKNNRRSEYLLQSTEQLSCAAGILTGVQYPQSGINESWETVLLNQFHDIIPGSSILEVYEDSDRDYARVRKFGETACDRALESIAASVEKAGVLVYNPNSFETSGIIELDGKCAYVKDIPSMGYKVLDESELLRESDIAVRVDRIENRFYEITLDEKGNITSIFDKENARDVTVRGELANCLEVFEDQPYDYDNWELSSYYKQKKQVLDTASKVEVFDEGARKGLVITHEYLSSTIVQKVTLYDELRRIDFDTTIDWKESHLVLKAAFPLDIHSDKATYDIQFGSLERNTHSNTSYDAAKFEVCAHKYADISEYGYGAAILNDCKYGYNAERNVLKLTLLKCGTYPNPNADKEIHKFTYSLLPHAGDHRAGGVIKSAYELGRPLVARKAVGGGKLKADFSLLSCDRENIIVETFKKAEDSDALVFRAYDAYNCKSMPTFDFGFDIKAAYLCDMLENKQKELEVRDGRVTLPVSNFEIVTIMLER